MRVAIELSAESVVRAVQNLGSDARDLRDAAHEAHHALSCGLTNPWERERIHRAVMRRGRAEAAINEIEARAVERIVCAEFGIDCGNVEQWAAIACMEAIKSGIRYPSVAWFSDRVRDYMKRPEMRSAADRIIRLGIIPRR